MSQLDCDKNIICHLMSQSDVAILCRNLMLQYDVGFTVFFKIVNLSYDEFGRVYFSLFELI